MLGDDDTAVATQPTLSTSGANPDGSGRITVTCAGATDTAGNTAAAVRATYQADDGAS